MEFRLNKEIAFFIAFIVSFATFMSSAYGIGKAEKDKDETGKTASIIGLSISLVVMLFSWIMVYGIQTPDSKKDVMEKWMTIIQK